MSLRQAVWSMWLALRREQHSLSSARRQHRLLFVCCCWAKRGKEDGWSGDSPFDRETPAINPLDFSFYLFISLPRSPHPFVFFFTSQSKSVFPCLVQKGRHSMCVFKLTVTKMSHSVTSFIEAVKMFLTYVYVQYAKAFYMKICTHTENKLKRKQIMACGCQDWVSFD